MTTGAGGSVDGADRLAGLLRAAVSGRFPEPDGGVELVGPYLPGVEAMVCFTGHAVAVTTLDRAVLVAAGADGLGGAASPAVTAALAGPDGEIGTLDLLLAAAGTGRTALRERSDLAGHPRVRHARHWRSDVHVHGDERGLVTIGRGLAGLPELSVEVAPDRRGHGHGRALLAQARGLAPEGEVLLAAVAPGNAASVRAALAAGFVPLGSVQLVRPGLDR